MFPSSVPSALYLADVFLYADDLLDGALLTAGPSKVLQASEEGMRVKRLVGALRYLYRNSHYPQTNYCFVFFLVK